MIEVIDGDTIKVYRDEEELTIRMIGVNTPETVDPRKPVECFGAEASAKSKELLLGKMIRLETDPSQGEFDKYGRTLAYIYRNDGLFYNKFIIEEGYAYEYTYIIPYKYQTEFKVAEQSAENNQKGLWQDGVCAKTVTHTQNQISNEEVTSITNPDENPNSCGNYCTSSYSTSKYYYPGTCSKWNTIKDSKYLVSFENLSDLLDKYDRLSHPDCE